MRGLVCFLGSLKKSNVPADQSFRFLSMISELHDLFFQSTVLIEADIEVVDEFLKGTACVTKELDGFLKVVPPVPLRDIVRERR